METKIPEQTIEAAQGWVLYDGECPLCTGAAARFAPLLRRHHFNLAPLQTPWVRQRLGLKPGAPLTEMKLLAADGRIFGGADALVHIARKIWWAWPLFVLAQIPGAMFFFRAIYRWIAANRHCLSNACKIPKQNQISDWIIAGTFVFDMRPYLTSFSRRLGYYAINIVFAYLPIVYAWAAWKGGTP